MKVNLKFGGINHSTSDVRARIHKTLVLGADLSHPGPGAIFGCPSIAAVVGSVDDNGGKFLGSMRLQTKQDQTDREVRILGNSEYAFS
jgi:eukaryotic translation initiation factor 2C